MNPLSPRNDSSVALFLLACLLTVWVSLALPSTSVASEIPACSTGDSSPIWTTSLEPSVSSPLFAAWYSKYVSGLATRSRVIQVCVAVMLLALAIIMKRLADVDR